MSENDERDLLERLENAAMAAFGEAWTTPASRYLGISDSLVRHWRRGSRPIPGWVGDRLTAMVRDAAQEAAVRAEELRGHAASPNW